MLGAHSNLDIAASLDDGLDDVLVDVHPQLTLLNLGNRLLNHLPRHWVQVTPVIQCDHDHTSWALSLTSVAQVVAAGDEEVGNVLFLADARDVGDDVYGMDIGGEDDHRFGRDDEFARVSAEGFDDFFDAALEGFVLAGCFCMSANVVVRREMGRRGI